MRLDRAKFRVRTPHGYYEVFVYRTLRDLWRGTSVDAKRKDYCAQFQPCNDANVRLLGSFCFTRNRLDDGVLLHEAIHAALRIPLKLALPRDEERFVREVEYIYVELKRGMPLALATWKTATRGGKLSRRK